MKKEGLALLRANPSLCLASDDSGNHHVVLRTDGNGVLVGTPGKGRNVFSEVGVEDDFIHKAPIGTVDGPGFIMIHLRQVIHLVDNGL